MRFIDEAKIEIKGGHGGPGAVGFHREKYIDRGGPDGGDGGKGGSVIFQSTTGLATLQDFRFKRIYHAEDGHKGGNSNMTGKNGEDIIVKVPVGTIIRDANTNEILFDFTEKEQIWNAAQGGRGGKGNTHFKTSRVQAPRIAQPGEDGEKKHLILELKLLADVGIIGFPNAGKSTLISAISAARPKIADYPFTTLVPNLGVVDLGDYQSAVFADIPGLVEGAHEGEGLGHQFLKHIERTKIFVHVLDGELLLHKDKNALLKSYKTLRKELELFNEKLIHKLELIVINKSDLLDEKTVKKACEEIKKVVHSLRGSHPLPNEPLVISAATSQNLDAVKFAVRELLPEKKKDEILLPDAEDIRS